MKRLIKAQVGLNPDQQKGNQAFIEALGPGKEFMATLPEPRKDLKYQAHFNQYSLTIDLKINLWSNKITISYVGNKLQPTTGKWVEIKGQNQTFSYDQLSQAVNFATNALSDQNPIIQRYKNYPNK